LREAPAMRFPLRLSGLPIMLLWCIYFSVPFERALSQSSSLPQSAEQELPSSEVAIPGPLRSIMRMAGISQKASKEEVVPLLARNIYVQGYEGWRTGGRPTEFLILLARYVNQANELAEFAGPNGAIRLDNCDDAPRLLHILGYRLRQQCGQNDA